MLGYFYLGQKVYGICYYVFIIIIEKIEDARSGLNSELIKKRSLTINNLLNELSTASLQSSTG